MKGVIGKEEVLVAFVGMFLVFFILSMINHYEYVKAFEIKCNKKGGVMVLPKETAPECRNPDFNIDI